MSQMRLNPLNGRWVTIVPNRAERPSDFAPRRQNEDLGRPCPFCPGNEEETAPAVESTEADGRWSMKVVPNLYPAFDGDDPFSADTWESSNTWTYALSNADCLRTTSNRLNTTPGDGYVYDRQNGAFGSQHPEGALFTFGDGHVEFVSETIEKEIYRSLSTISGGELVER